MSQHQPPDFRVDIQLRVAEVLAVASNDFGVANSNAVVVNVESVELARATNDRFVDGLQQHVRLPDEVVELCLGQLHLDPRWNDVTGQQINDPLSFLTQAFQFVVEAVGGLIQVGVGGFVACKTCIFKLGRR